MGEKSLADQLSEAWDAAEAGEEEQPLGDTGEDLAAAELSDEPAGDAGDAPAGEEPAGDEPGDDPAPAEGDDPADGREPPEAEGDDEFAEPPKGLPADAREEWADVPAAVRAAIHKREADFANGIQMYAQGARQAQEMNRVLQPYQQFFALNGGNPPQVLGGVLQTAATLQMGSPQQKAQAAANLIKQFGVDIAALDSLLAGQPAPAGGGADPRIDEYLNRRLQPIDERLRRLDEQDRRAQQQEQQSIQTEVEAFARDPKNEFYPDVREDMADLLEMAANRGVTMSLKDAYERACRMNPSVSKILQARQSRPSQQRRRAAASSVSGSRGGDSPPADPSDLRAVLENAWDEAAGV